jgi:hypothetical protein
MAMINRKQALGCASRRVRMRTMGLVLFLAILSGGCYTYRWTAPEGEHSLRPAPAEIVNLFAPHQGVISIDMVDPRLTYSFDPGEIDEHRLSDEPGLHFERVEIALRDRMAPGQVVVDFTFIDELGNRIRVPEVDIMRLLPRIDTKGSAQYAEYLLEEYERTGVTFRLEHGEFTVAPTVEDKTPALREALGRAYRVGIFNNCLDPGKWEFILTSQDYSDFDQRLDSDTYLDQNRILGHSWFYMDADLYQSMLAMKNPGFEFDPRIALDYMALAEKAKTSKIDFDEFRTLGKSHRTKIVELGYKSGRPLVEPIAEQYYKFGLNLFMNRNEYATYADLIKTPVYLAQFMDRGYYNPEQPKVYNYWFTDRLNEIRIHSINQPDSDCYVEIEIDGVEVPYKLTFGNLDLALLNEQSYASLRFGVNPYPISRRHSPVLNTIEYDSDTIPDRLKPYMFFTNKETGLFENNIDLGVEMVYIGWDDFDNNILEIYLVSYERITPVWVAKVKLPNEMVDRIRVRRNLYTY